jgi:para-nitrobenzyl esterase
VFAWRSPVQDLGAAHAVELGFVFDGLATSDSTALAGPDAPQSLATAMHGAWVSFVTTGMPQHPGMPAWPMYDPARRATMNLDVESHVIDDPDGETRQLWNGTDY